MPWFARLIYRALVWKERQRAQVDGRAAGQAVALAPPPDALPKPKHLETGERGETLAYWFLRQAGYTIVARNLRARSGDGEVDLIGWDGAILAFVEVKTRTSEEAGPPEEAVTRAKQKHIVKAAHEYLRRSVRKPVNYRFDIVSVAWDAEAGYQARLIRDAFKD